MDFQSIKPLFPGFVRIFQFSQIISLDEAFLCRRYFGIQPIIMYKFVPAKYLLPADIYFAH